MGGVGKTTKRGREDECQLLGCNRVTCKWLELTANLDHSYHLNNQPVKIATNQVDLGVVVSNDPKWSPHIACCTAKANRLLGFLRRNCSQVTDTRCRRPLYLSLVRSHLSYASEIWAPQSSWRDLAILEGVQRRATKFILQNDEFSYLERLRKLNLLPISYGLEMLDLIFFSNPNKASTA